jgi:hypothetical protein
MSDKDEIPITVLTMMFHFTEETRGMSHKDAASVALTLINELQKIADEETEAHAKNN